MELGELFRRSTLQRPDSPLPLLCLKPWTALLERAETAFHSATCVSAHAAIITVDGSLYLANSVSVSPTIPRTIKNQPYRNCVLRQASIRTFNMTDELSPPRKSVELQDPGAH